MQSDMETRFWAKVDKTDGCWLWTAATVNGYGYFGTKRPKTVYAHRFAYELLVGPIPPEMELDHVRCAKNCVRPDHLRLVTSGQNNENHHGARADSKTGVRGVSLCKQTGRWVGYVGHKGKQYNVGRFVRIEDAEAAVIAKRNELHTHNDADRVGAL